MRERRRDRAVAEAATPRSAGLADPAAFRRFYEEALPYVFGYFMNRCGRDVAVAEDLTQETFLAAVREIRRGSPVSAALPWVLGIARNKLVDHYRREERRERKLSLAWEAARTEDLPPWDDASLGRAVEVLDQVAPAQRAALVLRYVDGLGVGEVAAALGRSAHATESLLARGRDSFRRIFAECSDD